MMKMFIIVHLPMGIVAAILTAIEYFFSTLSALSARATIRGSWLLLLHRRGKMSISRKSREVVRSLLSFALGVSWMISVAVVESNLQTAYVIAPYMKPSTQCIPVDFRMSPRNMRRFTPPLQLVVEPWVMQIAEQMQCARLRYIGTGNGNNQDQDIGNINNVYMAAPVCYERNLSFDDRDGLYATTVGLVHVSSELTLSVDMNQWNTIQLFPYSEEIVSTVTPENASYTDRIVRFDFRNCVANNISTVVTEMHTFWQTMDIKSSTISKAILYEMCVLHGASAKQELPLEVERQCTMNETYIDVSCMRRRYTENGYELNAITLTNVSSLILSGRQQASHACIDASIKVEYIFISFTLIQSILNLTATDIQRPVLIPVAFNVLSGHCETTVHVLARAAMVYSADAEWRRTLVTRFTTRLERYHLHMIATATSIFPLDKLRHVHVNDTCYVRRVEEVTAIHRDWRTTFLSFVISCTLLIAVLGCGFRSLYNKQVWLVGSTEWSINQFKMATNKQRNSQVFKKDNEEDEDDILVVVQPQPETFDTDSTESFHEEMSPRSPNANRNRVRFGIPVGTLSPLSPSSASPRYAYQMQLFDQNAERSMESPIVRNNDQGNDYH